MKISGEITIFTGTNKIMQSNLLVDGAGKTICDILTIPPVLTDVNTSSILDTSNYTINALSFGKDATAWNSQAHYLSATPFFPLRKIPSFVSSNTAVLLPKQYNSLPSYPNPEDTELETLDVVPNLTLSGGYSIDRSWMYGGQLVNLAGLWREIYDTSTTPFQASSLGSYGLSDVSTLALRYGCFVSGNSTNNLSGVIMVSGDSPTTTAQRTTILSSTNFGYNNPAVRCMDFRGFINYIGVSSVGSVANYDKSGLVLIYNTSFSSTLEVEFRHTMDKLDVFTAGLYNGFNSLGLWSISLKDTLPLQSPPFTFHPVTNKRNYRLFSKKTFNKNLVDTPNTLGTTVPFSNAVPVEDLIISWKLKFK